MEFSLRIFRSDIHSSSTLTSRTTQCCTVAKFQLQCKVPAPVTTEMVATVANMKNGIQILKFLGRTFRWLQHWHDQMHSNGLLVVVATMIYGQKWRDAEVRRNFGVLTLSFQMARRNPSKSARDNYGGNLLPSLRTRSGIDTLIITPITRH